MPTIILIKKILVFDKSVVQLSDERNTTLDPMLLSVSFLHRKLDIADEIGRVTSRRKSTAPVQSLVNRASVAVREDNILKLSRFEVHVGQLGEENLGHRLAEHAHVGVPAHTFQEEAVYVGTILGRNLAIVSVLSRESLKVEFNFINSDNELTSVILLDTSQERLCEEETGKPEAGWCAMIDPILHELQAFNKIDNITSHRLERRIRATKPHGGNLVIEEIVANLFEFNRHDDLTLNSLSNVY